MSELSVYLLLAEDLMCATCLERVVLYIECVHVCAGQNDIGMNAFRGPPHPPQSPSWPECGMGMEGAPNASR